MANANDEIFLSDGTSGVVHGTGPDDTTPEYRGEYAFDCGGCYLGFPHSEAKHAAALNPSTTKEPHR